MQKVIVDKKRGAFVDAAKKEICATVCVEDPDKYNIVVADAQIRGQRDTSNESFKAVAIYTGTPTAAAEEYATANNIKLRKLAEDKRS